MWQPFLSKPGGQPLLLTILVQYIVVEIEKPLLGQRFAASEPAVPPNRLYSVESITKKPECQLVVGRRTCRSCCAEHSAKAKRFHSSLPT
eukprot:5796319-Amphidinium_carterae.1